MATHDYIISNASGAAVRADLNNALAAIVSNNSSATEPTTTYAYMWWADTGSSPPVLKIRNAANTNWITLFQLDGEFSTIALENGTAAAPSLYFKDSGTDTGLYSPGTDQVAITTAGTGRLFVDASGRILAGTSSSSVGGSGSIVLQGSAGPGVVRAAFGGTSPGSTDIIGAITFTDSSHTGAAYIYGSRDGGTWTSTTSQPSALSFGTTPSGSGTALERARIDSSGRLLVGTNTARSNFLGSASAAFQVEGNLSAGSTGQIISHVYGESAALGGPYLVLGKHRSGSIGGTTLVANNDQLGAVSFTGADGTSFREGARIQAFVDGTPGANDMPGRLVFSTTADGASSPTERMRITNAGDVLFGTTGIPNGTSIYGAAFEGATNSRQVFKTASSVTTANTLIAFYNPNGNVGTISISGSATAYNTSSDYRLKENVTPVTEGISRLQQLKPSRFNFIADPDKTVDGFIAHEVQDVVPEAITGEKDEVDEDGNPIYQGIDQSKLVPLLTAALQEAVARIETLEAKVSALEGAN